MHKLLFVLLCFMAPFGMAADDFVRRDFPEAGVYMRIPSVNNFKSKVLAGEARVVFSFDAASGGTTYQVTGVFENGIGQGKWSSQHMILDEFLKGSTRSGHSMHVLEKWDLDKWNRIVDDDLNGKKTPGWIRIKKMDHVNRSKDSGYFIMKIFSTSDTSEVPEFADKVFDSFQPVAVQKRKK